MSNKTKDLALQALIAAVYVAITFALQAVSYGPVQFRVSEFMLILVLLSRKNNIGIIVGTFIANFFSPSGIIDVVVGTLATVIAVELMSVVKNRWIQFSIPAIVNGIVIGLMLYYVSDIPFIVAGPEVFVFEAVVTFIPWVLVGKVVLDNPKIKEIFS